MLRGSRKDPQIITSSWERERLPVEGALIREVKHVPGDRGVLTEVFRPEWDGDAGPVAQAFQVRLFPGRLSAWHCHLRGTDRLFVLDGQAKIVLFDAREDSPTRGNLAEFHVGTARPTLVVVPPGVWHGIRNLGASDLIVLNLPTSAYDYGDPDHYRLPPDTPEIPYRWDV